MAGTLQSAFDAIQDFGDNHEATREDWQRLSELVEYYLDKKDSLYYDEDYLPEHDEEKYNERY